MNRTAAVKRVAGWLAEAAERTPQDVRDMAHWAATCKSAQEVLQKPLCGECELHKERCSERPAICKEALKVVADWMTYTDTFTPQDTRDVVHLTTACRGLRSQFVEAELEDRRDEIMLRGAGWSEADMRRYFQ